MRLWSQGWILQDKSFLGDFLRDAILGDFAYLDEVPMKVTFWKPRCPILQATMDWQGYSQRKLVSNNFSTLSSHAESPSEGYIPVSMPFVIFSGFSLPVYVSVSKSLCLLQRGKCHDNRVCGGNTGFWSLQPYWAVIQPTTDLGGNEFTICRESMSHCSHLFSSSAHLHSEQWQCLPEIL